MPSWVWSAGLVGLLALFLPGWWRWRQLQWRAERLEVEIALLERENQRLLAQMERLQHDPLYVERVARRKLGKARKGEIIYKLAPPPFESVTSDPAPPESGPSVMDGP